MSNQDTDLQALDELQTWVAKHIQSARGLARETATVAQARERLTGNDRLLPVEQLEIYRQQFWLRHTSSLVEDFPGLGGILGQREWERLVEGFLQHCPPSGWTLRDLGRDLPQYVAGREGMRNRELCTDMARLEWAFIELFDARDSTPLDLTRLAQFPPGALESGRIVLHPALKLLKVRYPVAELREKLIARAALATDTSVPIPDEDPAYLVLYRGANLRLFHRPVPAEAFALLSAMQAGLSLVASCERTLESLPDCGEQLQANVGKWFQLWSRRGWIVDVVPGSTDNNPAEASP